ncbi:hypothetical protein M3Y94_01175200 [Aphelenchoides besseyi]|nr:hypothetical protein M3Y94_01175200 [Aphelenchoides besseyi]
MKNSLKIVIVGDAAIGKSCLISTHTNGYFSENYTPTAFEDYTIEALINGKQQTLYLSDTAGVSEFSAMRPLSYPDCDVFLVCYSVESMESLQHIKEKWIPEVTNELNELTDQQFRFVTFCPSTPILIVGNKKDLRSQEKPENLVPISEAEEYAKTFSSAQLIECSSKSRENIKVVFQSAIRVATDTRNRRSNKVIQSIKNLRLVF